VHDQDSEELWGAYFEEGGHGGREVYHLGSMEFAYYAMGRKGIPGLPSSTYVNQP